MSRILSLIVRTIALRKFLCYPFYMEKRKLTPKQELFCLEYVVDFNATQAALRAKYSKKTAHTTGCENLKKPNVAARIAELQKPLKDKPRITRERVLEELANIAFSDVSDFWREVNEYDEVTGELKYSYREIRPDILKSPMVSAVAGFEPTKLGPKMKLHDKQKALDSLSRHLGLYNADTSQKPEVNQFDFTNISSDKLRKIKEILGEDGG